MTVKRKKKRKLKNSFKFFVAVIFLLIVAVILKLCGSEESVEDKSEEVLEEPQQESVIMPEITTETYNEFINIMTVTEGDVKYSVPLLDGCESINGRVEQYVKELSAKEKVIEVENIFYNHSYYSIEFSDGICVNYDVKNEIPLELKSVAPSLFEEYGEVPFLLDEDSVILYTEGGKKEVLFSEYGGIRYLPYNPPEYKPAADGEKVIALTFDDGPRRPEITAKILDKLVERRAKATFFVLGLECPGRGEILKRITDSGCEIGNHTYRHEQLNKISRQDAIKTVSTTQELVYESTGLYPIVMRPPYGEQREDIMEELGLFNVKWSIDPEDWKIKDANAIVEHVKEKAYSGAIVLMHDVYDASGEAAAELIDYFCDNGWRLVTVSELFDLKNSDFTKEVFCFKDQN